MHNSLTPSPRLLSSAKTDAQDGNLTRRNVLSGVASAATAAAGGLMATSCGTLAHSSSHSSSRSSPRSAGAPVAIGPTPPAAVKIPGGLEIRSARFFHDDRPFVINGMNYWSALPLSRQGNFAGWDQVRRDLDHLQSIGINTLRILGASEGPNNAPFRIVPALQPTQGHYDPDAVAGLLRLVDELGRRKLFAILVMNNFWHWSGGMTQYLAWAGEGPVTYPPPHPGGTWGRFQRHAARFYSNAHAKKAFQDLLGFLVPQLKSSPAVIWELANEPRGIDNTEAFRAWIDQTAGFIKVHAPGQLVTTGSEGQTPTPRGSGPDVVR
ncbi:MAG: cellulase family glycosylhydrolase, partial [Deltaproteobacteria bacterium]|nr:cellulase family glycosylhydrolase [Deltaproteobacteria bacterium]